LGLYKEAEPLLQEAYNLRKQIHGGKHADVAASLYNLGWLYHEQGKFPKAREYYQKSLDMRCELLGKDDPLVTSTLFNLAWLCGFMGDLDRSEKLFKEIIERRTRQHGTAQHRDVALAKAGLAGVYIEKQRFGDATRWAMEAARTFADLEGGDKMSNALSLF